MTYAPITIIQGDARSIPLADASVQCCVTSPPYWGLRDYGVAGQLGLEPTPDCLGWATGQPCGECYVCHLVQVFREVKRVLRDDGVVFLNLGDSYGTNGRGTGGNRVETSPKQLTNRGSYFEVNKSKRIDRGSGRWGGGGLAGKQLQGIPWRVAFALQADGWWLRSDIIWAKPNPMPESVTDRPTKAHEYLFLLAKQERYYYDSDAVKEPAAVGWNGSSFTDERDQLTKPGLGMKPRGGGFSRKYAEQQPAHGAMTLERPPDNGYRNRRSVWTIATSPYSGAHFATFPPALVEPCILAGSRDGDVVLDPFCGTATVGKVAVQHRRRFVGLDLNPAYIELARERTGQIQVEMGLTA